MYKLIENYFSFKDDRGEIRGLVNFGNWQEVNYVKSYKDTVRGNHYHKKTKEVIIILDGKINVELKSGDNVEALTLKKGDVILIEPMTIHTFTMLEDSSWINLMNVKNEKDAPDIYK